MKRSYRQNCALALSNDILGERWTLLIIRELLIQPCRFKDLNSVLIGMGTNLLTNRLKELEAAGLIERQSPGDKRSPYQLSPRGLEAEAIVLAMIRWGNGVLTTESDYSHQDHWDLLAMKALYKPELFNAELLTSKKANASLTVVFKTDDFNGWVKATAKGLSYGLGDSPLELAEKGSAVIELPMTIAQLQQILSENNKAKKELLATIPNLEILVKCFSRII
ncbi:MAG: helix-turn-helix domain-containing protein [Oleispira sp.]